eukprot:Tbor_TRINITY_DN2958_c0_g1::TRINITY_DN2958_c0_g1_i1::g.1110::m.1110/K03977/engA, der; GTPase
MLSRPYFTLSILHPPIKFTTMTYSVRSTSSFSYQSSSTNCCLRPITQRRYATTGSSGGNNSPVGITAIPPVSQIHPAMNQGVTWAQSEVKGIGKAKNSITRAMPDLSRTEGHRKRVAGWTPVVKVCYDPKLRIAIVGRMNCGKSSLFNVLCASAQVGPAVHKTQLVKDFDGMTRDAVEGYAEIGVMPFTLIDTPGLVGGKLVEEAMNTISTADAAIFVTSADEEVRQEERNLAAFLHARKVPTFLVVNKMDLLKYENNESSAELPYFKSPETSLEKHRKTMKSAIFESFFTSEEHEEIILARFREELQLGCAIPLSIRERRGLDMLHQCIAPLFYIHSMRKVQSDWAVEDLAAEGDERAISEIQERNSSDSVIRVAVIGRPSSGKSSLINRLIGYERVRASDEDHTTRDPIEINCTYKGRKLCIIDTAGMMPVASRRGDNFRQSLHHSVTKAVKYSHVIICMFDATEGHPSKFDMSLLHMAAEEGRPFILYANKWDIVLDPTATAEAIDFKIKRQVREVKYSTAVVGSAQTGLNLTLLMDQVLSHYERWNKKIRSSELTKFWRRFEKSVVIPAKYTRIGRVVQSKSRPPTFVLQLQTRSPDENFRRYMIEMVKNALCEEYGLHGVPIRIIQDYKDSHPDFI